MQRRPGKPPAAAAMYLGAVVALTMASPASAQHDPGSSEPHDCLLARIAKLDARCFHAHNRCDLEALRAVLASDMEAYHDLGGSCRAGRNT